MIYTLACTEDDLTVDAGVPDCTGGWVLIQQPEQFSLEQLDPIALGQLFGLGFTLVASVLLIGMGARAFLTFVKNA